VGVIFFHVMLGVLVLWTAYYDAPFGWKAPMVYKACGWLLVVVSLLGLIPILQKLGTITIEARVD